MRTVNTAVVGTAIGLVCTMLGWHAAKWHSKSSELNDAEIRDVEEAIADYEKKGDYSGLSMIAEAGKDMRGLAKKVTSRCRRIEKILDKAVEKNKGIVEKDDEKKIKELIKDIRSFLKEARKDIKKVSKKTKSD